MSLKLLRAASFGGLLVLGIVGTAAPSAAVDVFLKIPGIPGSSTDRQHPNEIEVQSIQYGLNNTGTASFGGGGSAGKATFQDINFTKKIDKSSPVLLRNCLTGTHFPSAVITTRKAGNAPIDLFKVTLTDVMVSSWSMTSGGDLPMESISLNFARVEWEYFIQGLDGTVKSTAKGGFDVKAGKASGGAASPPAGGGGAAAGSNPILPGRLPFLSGPGAGMFSSVARPRGIGNVGIYAKMTGIEGESRDQKHQNEIEVNSFSWGMTNAGTFSTGGGGGAGKVNVGDWNGTKFIDKAGVPLMVACATGRHIPEVVISMVKSGGDRPEFLRITLTDVMVTSYSHSAAGGSNDLPVESLSLNFAKMEVEYKEQNAQGQVVPAGKVTYDLKTNKS